MSALNVRHSEPDDDQGKRLEGVLAMGSSRRGNKAASVGGRARAFAKMGARRRYLSVSILLSPRVPAWRLSRKLRRLPRQAEAFLQRQADPRSAAP
jgi:hypothetical protein